MADLLRRVTIERGHDPRDFVMYANGGAGPSHAWVLARELGLKGIHRARCRYGSIAFGTANADIAYTVTQACLHPHSRWSGSIWRRLGAG